MSSSSTQTNDGPALVADSATTCTAAPPAMSSLYRRALVSAFTPMDVPADLKRLLDDGRG